ncbi:hypothetical protein F2Q70_00040686 [Brassica cretica]|uniref:Uncharacterized protein n=1 Tax=Brassica cretica TaxID=69181 RepID=A0A8S9K9P7_BRACR|nr:hypothetical protein F2Q70_00040686 [Brassica cretica]
MCQNVPEIECGLNDLTENDFNTTFKLVPSFLDKQAKEKCFVSGVPGSFYSRLFPSKSLHFVHSSFSVHWLSKFPDGMRTTLKAFILIIHALQMSSRVIQISSRMIFRCSLKCVQKRPCPPNVFKS